MRPLVSGLAVASVLLAAAWSGPVAHADDAHSSLSKRIQHRLRGNLRSSFSIPDKRGVPDAIRLGADVGALVLRRGLFDLSMDSSFVFGFSEKIGHSYRVGSNIELDRRLPRLGASIYATTGLHYFVSRAAEDRKGLLWRASVGFRVNTSRHVYVGFEPFAIERMPNGEGVQTPVRTRWAWEMVFLSVGFRP